MLMLMLVMLMLDHNADNFLTDSGSEEYSVVERVEEAKTTAVSFQDHHCDTSPSPRTGIVIAMFREGWHSTIILLSFVNFRFPRRLLP